MKYRLWDIRNKKFLEDDWETEYAVRKNGLVIEIYDKGFGEGQIVYDLENIIISQPTGLMDSQGYELYEDDIVWNEYDEEYQVVIYDEGEYKLMGESHMQSLYNNLDYIDIRGNIYEKFELVKEWYESDYNG
nr:MAG TPA: YopX protein [Caudoviricetes sp.]